MQNWWETVWGIKVCEWIEDRLWKQCEVKVFSRFAFLVGRSIRRRRSTDENVKFTRKPMEINESKLWNCTNEPNQQRTQ